MKKKSTQLLFSVMMNCMMKKISLGAVEWRRQRRRKRDVIVTLQKITKIEKKKCLDLMKYIHRETSSKWILIALYRRCYTHTNTKGMSKQEVRYNFWFWALCLRLCHHRICHRFLILQQLFPLIVIFVVLQSFSD